METMSLEFVLWLLALAHAADEQPLTELIELVDALVSYAPAVAAA